MKKPKPLKPAQWKDLVGKKITEVETDAYGAETTIITQGGDAFIVRAHMANAMNDRWPAMFLLKQEAYNG